MALFLTHGETRYFLSHFKALRTQLVLSITFKVHIKLYLRLLVLKVEKISSLVGSRVLFKDKGAGGK